MADPWIRNPAGRVVQVNRGLYNDLIKQPSWAPAEDPRILARREQEKAEAKARKEAEKTAKKAAKAAKKAEKEAEKDDPPAEEPSALEDDDASTAAEDDDSEEEEEEEGEELAKAEMTADLIDDMTISEMKALAKAEQGRGHDHPSLHFKSNFRADEMKAALKEFYGLT